MTTSAKKVFFESALQPENAIALFNTSEASFMALFNRYECLESLNEKQVLADKICSNLLISLQYEAKESAMSITAMNHSVLKYLVAEIKNLDVDSVIFDVKIRVLAEQVKQHFRQKQSEMAKAQQAAEHDLCELGARIAFHREPIYREPMFARSRG